MVGTKVALRLSSAGEALGTQLRAEPCLDVCFSLLYSIFPMAELQFNDFGSIPNPSIFQLRCTMDSIPNAEVQQNLMKPLHTHWGEPTTMRNNVPECFSLPWVKAAAFPIPGWNQGSWFHLSSSWLFQALWWHHYRFPPTPAAWILGSPHTASKLKDTCQRQASS